VPAREYQAFHIGPPEVEVPDLGIFEPVIPVADPRKRRIHNDPSAHPRRVKRCKRVADHVADVVGDESNILNPQLVQNASEVLSLSDLFVSTILMRRQAHAAQVGDDYGAVFHQNLSERNPHVAGVILALGGAVAWPLAARAQQASKLPTVGYLGANVTDWIPRTAAFVGRLRELGWIEGRTCKATCAGIRVQGAGLSAVSSSSSFAILTAIRRASSRVRRRFDHNRSVLHLLKLRNAHTSPAPMARTMSGGVIASPGL
jgi:hypothetical protein